MNIEIFLNRILKLTYLITVLLIFLYLLMIFLSSNKDVYYRGKLVDDLTSQYKILCINS